MQNVAKFRLIEGLLSTSARYVRIVAYMSIFFYLGPIRTSESQSTINKQKLPQMTCRGLLICKQTFSQNVAKFRLIEPSTYNGGIYVHFFLFRPNTYESAQYLRMSLKEPLMYKRCLK